MADEPRRDPETIGERIRTGRLRRGLSLADLATGAGLSTGHLSKLERGQIPRPGLDTLDRIAEALGIRTTDLVRAPATRTRAAKTGKGESPEFGRFVRALERAGRRPDRDLLEAIRGLSSNRDSLDAVEMQRLYDVMEWALSVGEPGVRVPSGRDPKRSSK